MENALDGGPPFGDTVSQEWAVVPFSEVRVLHVSIIPRSVMDAGASGPVRRSPHMFTRAATPTQGAMGSSAGLPCLRGGAIERSV